MGMPQHNEIVVPRGVLIAAGIIMLFSIGLAGAARHARLSAPPVPKAPPKAVVEVRFHDAADGSIRMLDASTERELAVVPPRSDGFVRGVLRGMFRTRKLESMDREARFRLAREADGHLTLEDPQTARRIELDSFGPDNTAAFARLLEAGVAAGGTSPSATGRSTSP